MKEQIISLLSANCTLIINTKNFGGIIIEKESDLDTLTTGMQQPIESIEVLEVIPPKVIEYKVGDEVMVYREMERDWEVYGKRRWPFTIVEHDFNFWSYYVEGGDLEYWERQAVWDQPICKRFEWVQYNPLPTESNDE